MASDNPSQPELATKAREEGEVSSSSNDDVLISFLFFYVFFSCLIAEKTIESKRNENEFVCSIAFLMLFILFLFFK
jgi:hypothetical protein